MNDKLKHLIVCLAITLVIGLLGLWLTDYSQLPCAMCAAGVSMLIGFGKEIYDIKHSAWGFEVGDLLADLIGTIIGVVILLLV